MTLRAIGKLIFIKIEEYSKVQLTIPPYHQLEPKLVVCWNLVSESGMELNGRLVYFGKPMSPEQMASWDSNQPLEVGNLILKQAWKGDDASLLIKISCICGGRTCLPAKTGSQKRDQILIAKVFSSLITTVWKSKSTEKYQTAYHLFSPTVW